MFRLFYKHLFTRRCITIGVGVIFAVSSLPGIAIACEGIVAEERLEEREGGAVAIGVFNGTGCRENVRLRDVSTVAHNPIKVVMEKVVECSFRREGCRNFEFLRARDQCESELERALRAPVYEDELEYERRRFGPYRTRL
jgi:hypothetical protein